MRVGSRGRPPYGTLLFGGLPLLLHVSDVPSLMLVRKAEGGGGRRQTACSYNIDHRILVAAFIITGRP